MVAIRLGQLDHKLPERLKNALPKLKKYPTNRSSQTSFVNIFNQQEKLVINSLHLLMKHNQIEYKTTGHMV